MLRGLSWNRITCPDRFPQYRINPHLFFYTFYFLFFFLYILLHGHHNRSGLLSTPFYIYTYKSYVNTIAMHFPPPQIFQWLYFFFYSFSLNIKFNLFFPRDFSRGGHNHFCRDPATTPFSRKKHSTKRRTGTEYQWRAAEPLCCIAAGFSPKKERNVLNRTCRLPDNYQKKDFKRNEHK